MGSDLGPWDPLAPDGLADLLSGLGCPWWIAGGWAIDLHLGRQTRKHPDTDALILRRDQERVRDLLADWDVNAADPPGSLRPWPIGEPLPRGVHDVWVRRTPDDAWMFQLMIDDSIGDDWIYRRDATIARPIMELSGPRSTDWMSVLAPEVQLLYKSKDVRPKDQADFDAVLPAMDASAREWLRSALLVTSPVHAWLAHL